MIPTFAGQATRGETYAKLLYHLTECQELAAVMAHLHNTEEHSFKDRALAKGWLTLSEMFKRIQHQVTSLASGALQ